MTERTAEQQLLEARARALAKPRGDHDVAVLSKYAVFERGGVRYGIEPRYVFAVSHVLAPTPLPNAAPHWAGVSSIHGELLALVDLSVLLDAGANSPASTAAVTAHDDETDTRLVLVLGTERRELALVIDAVLESKVLDIDLARTPGGDALGQLILGLTADDTHVIRGDALLADPRLFIEQNHFTES